MCMEWKSTSFLSSLIKYNSVVLWESYPVLVLLCFLHLFWSPCPLTVSVKTSIHDWVEAKHLLEGMLDGD